MGAGSCGSCFGHFHGQFIFTDIGLIVLVWGVCVFCFVSFVSFVLVGCVCVCVLFCFFCFDLVCVCVLAGSAFCMLFCFGLVCVCFVLLLLF